MAEKGARLIMFVMDVIVKLGKLAIYWLMQLVFFGAIMIAGLDIDDGYDALIPLIIGGVLFTALVFLYTQIIRRDTRKAWVYFFVIILIASSVLTAVIGIAEGETITLGGFLTVSGGIGLAASFLMPLSMLFFPRV